MTSVQTTNPQILTGASDISARIDGNTYATSDASSGGVNVYDIQGDYAPGRHVALVMNVPFRTFSLDVNLAAEVQNYDAEGRTLGLIFPELNADHTAHLNRALKAYSSADVIATNSLSKTVSRDGFMKVAKVSVPAIPVAPKAKKQVFGMTLATLLGLAALSFIVWNIYHGVYTVNSTDAVIGAPDIHVRATATGIFISQLDENALSVTEGQELGSIAGASGPVISPCDCLVNDKIANNGEYVVAGEKLFSLTSNTAKPWVMAEVEAERALRIGTSTPATVMIAGSEIAYTAKVVAVTSAMNAADVPGTLQKFAKVKLTLDQEIPAEFVGKPAQVLFTVK